MAERDRIDVTGMTEEEVKALVTPEMLEEGERMMAHVREIYESLTEDSGQTARSSLLKPCPFCGGKGFIQYWGFYGNGSMESRVVCSSCHAATSRDFESRTTYIPTGEDITKALVIEKAIKTWNRRA